jgi:hypothetical protein
MEHANCLKLMFLGTSVEKTRLYRKLKDWKFKLESEEPPLGVSSFYRSIQYR